MRASRTLIFSLASALFAASAALGGCTVTTIHTTAGDAAATEPPPGADDPGGDASAGDPGDDDAGPGTDGGGKKDSGTAPASDSGAPPKTDAGGPVLAGGSITVTCPPSGFHAGPPVTIASVPSAYLPRCTAATKACYMASATAAAGDACLDADTMPPAVVGGESVNCKQCERTQGSYCLAYACKSEFTAYACCAQAEGEAKCAGALNAVTSCAGSSGKAAFQMCLNSLIPRCFQ